MEDENEIELSLGLSCGGSSRRSKVKDVLVDQTAGEGSLRPSHRPFVHLSSTNQETNLFGEKSGLHKRKSSAEQASPQKKLDRAFVTTPTKEDDSGDLDEGTESETEGSSSWIGTPVDRDGAGATVDHGKSTQQSNSRSLQPLVFQASTSVRQPATPFRSSNQALVYSAVRLPTLESPSSWILGSHQSSGGLAGAEEEPEREEHQVALMGLERWGIKPGIGPDVVFGGSGTRPDLPWVSTTGPSGRTVSGVTYKYSSTDVRIVCACHGAHHTPEEFVQHASVPKQENQGSSNNSVAPG